MARALPAVGDLVTVHVVGRITGLDGTTGLTLQTLDGAGVRLAPSIRDDDGFAWEPTAAPEAVYVAGEIYRDADGALVLRNETTFLGDRWTVIRMDGEPAGRRVHEDRPARPLQRLVPEESA